MQAEQQLSKVKAILAGDTDGLKFKQREEHDETTKPLYKLPDNPHARPLDRLSAPRAELEQMALHERVELDGTRNLVEARPFACRAPACRAASLLRYLCGAKYVFRLERSVQGVLCAALQRDGRTCKEGW